MQDINEVLKGEARLLWEAGEVYDLDPEEMAPYIGVSVDRVYEWLGGGEIPTDEERAKIRAGVELMKAKFEPDLKMEKLPSGAEVSVASWGDPADDLEDPAIIADKARSEAIRPLFAALMKAVSENEKPLVLMGWPDFSELLAMLMKHHIRFSIE